MIDISPDAKEVASHTFADVVYATRYNFPEAAYRPEYRNERYSLSPGPHRIIAGADGIGTKPELAERLATMNPNMSAEYFEGLAHDVIAMVADDAARDGHFVLGIMNALDVNSAEDPEFIGALARGMKNACDIGGFPLLNGKTAELGYRTPGMGNNHLNWNAVAVQLVNERKIISGEKLKPGQPVVGLREGSIRSNGLTRARQIVEQAYISQLDAGATKRDFLIADIRARLTGIDEHLASDLLNAYPSILECEHLPWHTQFPKLTKKLLTPSTIYAPLISAAQGGVDGNVQVPLVACAHITGGGVPFKGKRMMQKSGLGLHLEAVFEDPAGIKELLELAEQYPHPTKGSLVTHRQACEQWNRGIGFLCVLDQYSDAEEFIALAEQMGYEAKVAGETIAEKKIEWHGETWTY